MSRWKEIAKFLCGFEAFHALLHAYLWASAIKLTIGGMELAPSVNAIGFALNAIFALLLGVWAWRSRKPSSRPDS